MQNGEMKNIIIAITGASGAVYGIRLIEELKARAVTVHLCISTAAATTIPVETGRAVGDVIRLADHCYDIDDIGAPIASGSFPVDGMIVAPCSIKTLSSIAYSYADNIITRACDVTLKERRPLIMLVREAPYHLGHIRLMERATEIGGIVLPPVTAMYAQPQTVDDVVNQTVGKALDLLGIDNQLYKRWG